MTRHFFKNVRFSEAPRIFKASLSDITMSDNAGPLVRSPFTTRGFPATPFVGHCGAEAFHISAYADLHRVLATGIRSTVHLFAFFVQDSGRQGGQDLQLPWRRLPSRYGDVAGFSSPAMPALLFEANPDGLSFSLGIGVMDCNRVIRSGRTSWEKLPEKGSSTTASAVQSSWISSTTGSASPIMATMFFFNVSLPAATSPSNVAASTRTWYTVSRRLILAFSTASSKSADLVGFSMTEMSPAAGRAFGLDDASAPIDNAGRKSLDMIRHISGICMCDMKKQEKKSHI